MGKIAILHTTTATVLPLNTSLKQQCEHVLIENFVDDSILPMLLNEPDKLDYAFEKLLAYSQFAQKQGAQLILNACSSVGDFGEYAKNKIQIPIIRIDDAVSDLAVKMGTNITVLATLPTTLEPSVKLLMGKGNGETTVKPILVEGAFAALKEGNATKHNELICEAATSAADADIIYLAQASMAEAVEGMPASLLNKVMYSTIHAVRTVAELYKKTND